MRKSTSASPGWSLSTFDDSLLAVMRKSRGQLGRTAALAGTPRVLRWGVAGAVLGGLSAIVAFAPASWLAGAVSDATAGRLILAEAEGSLWQGSALPVLTGGPGSKDAALLPSRLDWSVSPFWGGLRLKLAQGCCIEPGLELDIQPGWNRLASSAKS